MRLLFLSLLQCDYDPKEAQKINVGTVFKEQTELDFESKSQNFYPIKLQAVEP
jgi:hypothetical protein